MKKIFPVIVVLITLSLLGIIIIQVSWFKNLLQVQEQRILFRVDESIIKVIQDISKQSSFGPKIRFQPRPDLKLFPENYNFHIKPPSIAQRYTRKEIQDKLQEAFNQNGLKNVEFEFAVISDLIRFDIVMQSANFQNENLDTSKHKQRILPINAEAGSDLEGLVDSEYLCIVVPHFRQQLWSSLAWMVTVSVVFSLIILAAFYVTVRTLYNQRKLSMIKSDFINNMTHEFKTPLATISLAVDALRNERVLSDREKMNYFSGIIKEENTRMNKHVETILQAALMEKQEFKLNLHHVHLHELITGVVDNFKLRLLEKNAKLELFLTAKNDLVPVDEVHFTNVISNLVDNAVKYSKDDSIHIKLYTHCTSKHFILRIEDNGIGMNKETVKRIFEKFYRAHTGNIHNVKGFGLGMSYVKTVVDAHEGRIKVESTLGKGSTFTLELPIAKKA